MKTEDRSDLSILVVDDIQENLVAMRALLEQDGLTIHEAKSGTEALEILLVHDVALAIVDVQMPGMDGFELAALMRGSARTQKVPIIFVTASSAGGRQSQFEGYELGAVDYLFKPIDGHVLKSKCAVFLELYRQRRAIEAQLRTNELVVAAVGHDLRNPLNAMLMGLHLVREAKLEPREKQIVERIHKSGLRMARLIDDLYDVARVRLGSGIDLELKENVDLGALVRAAVTEAQTAGAPQRIEVEEVAQAVGRFDPDRLARVFSNLLGNAVRHGRSDEPVRVTITLEGLDYAVVRFTNGGVISKDVLPALWDPFRRGSTAGTAKGLGLGLFIVRAIVIAHRGVANAHSDGERTTFEVKLPTRLLP